MLVFFESEVDVPQEDIMHLISKVMKNEKITGKPSKHNVIHIAEEKMEGFNKVVLQAVMTNSLEQKLSQKKNLC